jgi:hypothetical protein
MTHHVTLGVEDRDLDVGRRRKLESDLGAAGPPLDLWLG